MIYRSAKTSILLLIVAALLIVVASFAVSHWMGGFVRDGNRRIVSPEEPACLMADAWYGLPSTSMMDFRYEDSEESSFLLRRSYRDAKLEGDLTTIYRYDVQQNRIEAVNADTWDHASGAVTECMFRVSDSSRMRLLHVEKSRGSIVSSTTGQSLRTAARTPLRIAMSPSRRYASVVSTTGSNFLKFGLPTESPDPEGPRYQQFISISPLEAFGEVVRLPK